jgi:hypothetical protein
MHPGSTSPRPDPKAPIDRHSLTDGGLEGIYNRYQDLANVGGGSAKDVGLDNTATNAINGTANGPIGITGAVINDIAQKNFKIKQPIKITQFTNAGLNYIDTKGINTTKYAPSGRL